uniref:Endoplasmic reticulum vesicle transporter C-terminal domain-containing protein n=1 Tax=Chromera velia CCMP2878 TaxID=1169474 RepID=A0A0G4GDN9_9ALVE|eukprot:Cvel_21346.t1-p1 / transcript=Cvel_21346.t1 / gene=Cvel_21346 / organism=Chromera_velia_CCMP2878 / gene_product=Endoplasmic reticulum-Golgi intermediate, putative / transcript_product=Endoplasmic reticulum-Golgi intermediate, putative / location=Cvel_scaffold1992:28461-34815(+) / protein_length=199 / sequence_SO=supercontig / SO=protein_coding / is_pseudo=false
MQKSHNLLELCTTRCEFISVDTVDSVGEHQVDVQGEILKTPVDSDGVGHHAGRCCNTCMQLQEAWGEKGWSKYDVIAIAPQCKEGRGCNVAGKVTVNKIGGNVHVALGKSQVRDGKHIHEYSVTETERNVKVIKERLTGLPGVFFVYDFNPFLIQKEERRGMQFHQFIISVVAIVGGVSTFCSVLSYFCCFAVEVTSER